MVADANPSVPDASRAAAYVAEQLAAFKRWQSRTKVIAYPAGVLAFALVLYLLSTVMQSGAAGVVIAIVLGIAVESVLEYLVLPRLTMPSVRCPFCAGAVPIAEPPKGLRRLEQTRVCPNCRKDLPH